MIVIQTKCTLLKYFYIQTVLAPHGGHLQGGDTEDKSIKMIHLYNNTLTVSPFTSLPP